MSQAQALASGVRPSAIRGFYRLARSSCFSHENQQVVSLSDGGEDILQVREYPHPNSEYVNEGTGFLFDVGPR